MIWKLATLGIVLILVASLTGCEGNGQADEIDEAMAEGEEAQYQIAVIPKGRTHDFWRAIHAGARKAADELDVNIIWMSGEREDDRRQQIDVVQNFIARGVDAIVLAPLDENALVRPVEEAERRGIPVIIIDSGLQTDQYRSFIATDNYEGGRLGGRRLGDLMEGEGKAMMLRYSEGSASTAEREQGFLDEIRENYPDIELLSYNQYAGATQESAFQASQTLLNRYGAEVEGIFCPNESSSFGMLRALQTGGYAGEVLFVGFDTNESLLRGLREGEIHGLVSQDPFGMGYEGVIAAVDVLEGREVEESVATQLDIVTPDNVDDPEIQELIAPELVGAENR